MVSGFRFPYYFMGFFFLILEYSLWSCVMEDVVFLGIGGGSLYYVFFWKTLVLSQREVNAFILVMPLYISRFVISFGLFGGGLILDLVESRDLFRFRFLENLGLG